MEYRLRLQLLKVLRIWVNKRSDKMKILVACEESQRVCLAFREKGHEAYSCDIINCSGGHPEYHARCFTSTFR